MMGRSSREMKESGLDSRKDKIERVKGLVEPVEKSALLENLSYLCIF